MLKKTITYEDFNEEIVTEDHFFHLSKADLIELELSADGGMEAHLKKIVDSSNNREIFSEFKRLMLSAYGKRSEDGKRFIKSAAICDEFESSEAFSNLLMGLLEDENAAAAFINGIVPKGLRSDTPQAGVPENATDSPPVDPATPATDALMDHLKVEAPRTLTPAEMVEMDANQLKVLLATGKAVIGK